MLLLIDNLQLGSLRCVITLVIVFSYAIIKPALRMLNFITRSVTTQTGTYNY